MVAQARFVFMYLVRIAHGHSHFLVFLFFVRTKAYAWSLTPQSTLVFSISSPLHHAFEKAVVNVEYECIMAVFTLSLWTSLV